MELNAVTITSEGKVYLDDKELVGVTAYELKDCAGNTPAQLTLTMYVNVGRVGSAPQK